MRQTDYGPARNSGFRRFQFPFFLSVAMVLLLFSWRLLKNSNPTEQAPENKAKSAFDIRRHPVQVRLDASTTEELVCVANLPLQVPVTVLNLSPEPLISGQDPAAPSTEKVNLSYRFYNQSRQTLVFEGKRHLFPTPIPGCTNPTSPPERSLRLPVTCPPRPGTWLLSIQLVQEGIAWQQDVQRPEHYVAGRPVRSFELADLVNSKTSTRYLKQPAVNQFQGLPRAQQQRDKLLSAYQLAVRLLDTTTREVQGEEAPVLVSEAGSNYPMVWSRDMATIQHALTLTGVKNQPDSHWAELFFRASDQPSGQIPDWVSLSKDSEGRLISDKNNVQSDQELWLVDSVLTALETGWLTTAWLKRMTEGISFSRYISRMLDWVIKERFSDEYGCIFNGHTADWGDVALLGADSAESTRIDTNHSRVCGLFLQSLFIKVTDRWMRWPALNRDYPQLSERLSEASDAARRFIRDRLQMPGRRYFRMHIHLDQPEKELPDEDPMFALGGHVMAFEAGLLDDRSVSLIGAEILQRQKVYRISTPGAVLLPPYPERTFDNSIMAPFEYQNGGQWDWFGARAAPLLQKAQEGKGVEGLLQIAEKVLRNKTFFEWDHPDGSPGAGPHFLAGAAAYIIGFHDLFGRKGAGDPSMEH